MIRRFLDSIEDFLQNPKRVFVACLVFLVMTLILDGTWLKIWNLTSEMEKLQNYILSTRSDVGRIKSQIELTNNPEFIEREARERFDLVEADDLVFVFSDEEER